VLTFLVLGGMFVLGMFGFMTVSDESRAVFNYISLWTQMDSFSKGIIDTRYVVYDLSVACLSVFMAVRVLQANRWQ
jgi:ABC-2 type transport system permease protein